MRYVVYLTHYKGDKLPPWYIGSSSYEKVLNGYNGSVGSRKYKEIYLEEQKNNKHLFNTKILSFHNTRKNALSEELRLQTKHEVIKNNKYINLAYAKENGFFGLSLCGKLHPQFGTKRDAKLIEQTKIRQLGEKNSFYGKSHSLETKTKIREKQSGEKNPFFKNKHNKKSILTIRQKSGTCKGTSYLYNIDRKLCRRVPNIEVQTHLDNGWEIGRRVFKENQNVGKITIYNKNELKNRNIYPQELEEFLAVGWKVGKYNFSKIKKRMAL